jgi:GT2 family glycosyltransferase
MPKTVAVLLLNWNTPVHTLNCINSLLTHCNKNLFDIIVADNGSTDGSLATLKAEFPDLVYLDNQENLGYAEGNNRAIQYSIENGYSHSLILNNDTEVDQDLVTGLLQHLQNHPEAAAVQPAIYWLHDKTAIWNGEGKYNALTGKIYSDKTIPKSNAAYSTAQWLTGCCMLVKNEILKTTGLFNKQFFLYYEDVELCYRIRASGQQLHYLPSVKLYHEAGASSQRSSKEKEGTLSPIIHYYVNRNHIWFLRRFGNPLFYPVMLLCYFPYYLAYYAYFILRGRTKKAEYLFNGIKDGFFTPETVIWPELKKGQNNS